MGDGEAKARNFGTEEKAPRSFSPASSCPLSQSLPSGCRFPQHSLELTLQDLIIENELPELTDTSQ